MGTGVYENLCANVMFAAPLDGMRELLDWRPLHWSAYFLRSTDTLDVLVHYLFTAGFEMYRAMITIKELAILEICLGWGFKAKACVERERQH